MGSSSFSGRAGELSRQSSKQQRPAAMTTSTSFNKSSNPDSKQLQAYGLSGKHKQAGPMQRFLKQYSLDRKGLFAP